MPPIYVFYDPTGTILQVLMGNSVNPDAVGLPYIEVTEYRHDYCTAYHVVDGEVVPL